MTQQLDLTKLQIKSSSLDDFTNPQFFASREDWDAHDLSHKSHEKKCIERKCSGPYERAYSEPTEFPCLGFEGPLIRNANGPDEYVYFFIYSIENTVNEES